MENRISQAHAIAQLSTNHRTMCDLKAACHPGGRQAVKHALTARRA